MQIYIHIPFCKSKCKYCDFNSSADVEAPLKFAYISAIQRELSFAGKRFANEKVDTIYIGGGTPSVLDAKEIGRIFSALSTNFDLSAVKEFTIECNPESITEDKLAFYHDHGVDRISIGVQSLYDRNLRCIGRLHTAEEATKKLRLAADYFDNISADLIIGLPYDSDEIVRDEVSALSEYVSHMSVYQLTLESGTPLAKRVSEGRVLLPTDDEAADYEDIAIDVLSSLGFERYEVSNFARDGKISLHNFGYWTRESYIGIGAGAHSLVKSDENGAALSADIRFASPKDVNAYIGGINCVDSFDAVPRVDMSVISKEEATEEEIMLGLRTNRGVNRELLDGRIPSNVSRYFEQVGKNIRLTRDGMAVMNSILIRILSLNGQTPYK